MPDDFCMCLGKECPIKEQCYLYRAKPSEYRQSYFSEVPYKDEKCEFFVKFHEKSKVKK